MAGMGITFQSDGGVETTSAIVGDPGMDVYEAILWGQ
jgi:hypothetical protein